MGLHSVRLNHLKSMYQLNLTQFVEPKLQFFLFCFKSNTEHPATS